MPKPTRPMKVYRKRPRVMGGAVVPAAAPIIMGLRLAARAWMDAGKTVKPGAGPIGGSGRSLLGGTAVMAANEVDKIRDAVRPQRTKRRVSAPRPKPAPRKVAPKGRPAPRKTYRAR
jgi:hypothetical protein